MSDGIYYESKRVTLWLGDARTVLPRLDKESIDCVAMDPPYGMNWQSNTRKAKFKVIGGDNTLEEAQELLAEVAPDIWRVLRTRRHLYSFGISVNHPLLTPKVELIWDKGRLGSGDLSSVWASQHETIHFQVRQPDKANATAGRGGLVARLRKGSVLSVPRASANQVKRHPTEKPVALMRQLIESSTSVGETVLDPFSGSGSTLVAAVLEGRKAVGVELDQTYADVAAERLAEVEKLMDEVDDIA